jgi:inner membrane protein
MSTETNITDRVNNWMKHSVTLKLVSITILVLLLLIPTSMIKSIISEREKLSSEAVAEVSSKWANSQTINGPILTIPLIYEAENKEGKYETIKYMHILPDELKIDGQVNPEKLKRGIYEIVVYKSNVSISGQFQVTQKIDQNNLKSINYEDAFLTIGLSDLRGIKENIIVNWADQKIKAQPGSMIQSIISSGVTIGLTGKHLTSDKPISFDFELKLQGSENLSFTPIGSTTNVKLLSDWSSPSFNGNFLPNDRSVSDSGFTASWKVLQLNRNFPQSWVGNGYSKSMDEASFGVDLILPMDDYQKSMRSAKYAIMTITLTFLIFFLVEVLQGRKIHAFQYTLVGLALSLFYVLLISISEHTNFNLAYGIATIATVSMITLYSKSVFKQTKIIFLLLAVLLGIYGFLFVTLQLTDFALLLGAIGLSSILGATMYFTRNVNWYQLKSEAV